MRQACIIAQVCYGGVRCMKAFDLIITNGNAFLVEKKNILGCIEGNGN